MKSFKQFIITKTDIDNITYGTPTVQQQERMDKELEYFSEDVYDLVKMGCPPNNTSNTTKNELYYLHRVEKDEELFKKYDLHFSPSLFEYAEDNDLDYDFNELKKIKKEVSNIILHSKFHFNRPRPYQLAEAYNIDLEHMNTESGHTPAYPSGHAAQSRILALLIARDNPEHKEELIAIADDIALSRELGGVHYPSDNDFGKELGDLLYEELTGDCPCSIGENVITEAEYQGNKVELNKPFRTPGESKKFAVYTKNDRDKVVIVRFGDPNMEIKRDDPKRRANFRSRHNCDNPGPKWKARYWSCYQWRAGAKVDD